MKFGYIRSISLYSVEMWENTDQKNSEYGHVSRSTNQRIIGIVVLKKPRVNIRSGVQKPEMLLKLGYNTDMFQPISKIFSCDNASEAGFSQTNY